MLMAHHLFQHGRCYIRDEGSENGTFLFLSRGARDKHAVVPGDIFGVGGAEFEVTEIVLEQTLQVSGLQAGSKEINEIDGLRQAEELGKKLLGVSSSITRLEAEDEGYVKLLRESDSSLTGESKASGGGGDEDGKARIARKSKCILPVRAFSQIRASPRTLWVRVGVLVCEGPS